MDPRPLLGEPLPLDLVNTRWTDDEGVHDLLALPGGLATWLTSAGLADTVEASPETLDALLVTRDALARGDADRLNETLRHGAIRRRLGVDGPENVVEVDAPGWRAAWLAAEQYLRLLEQNPSRLRQCANPECTLRFYDVSKAGARRWCSMAACGNRAKARSHYARQHHRA